MTRHVPYSEFRKNPAKYMDEARDSRVVLYIDRAKGPPIVVLSADKYEGLAHMVPAPLLQSRANAKGLLATLATLAPLDEDFPPISDPVPDPVEL
jgi:prevent-host-death family protein